MNLSVKKLRRSATVIGGTFLGLTAAAALATPALACHSDIQKSNVCVNADGTWNITWTISPSDGTDVKGHVTKVVDYPAGTLKGIVGDTDTQQGTELPATGTQTLSADTQEAWISVDATFYKGGNIQAHNDSEKVSKPTEKCDNTPPSTPKPPSNPKPTEEPQFVYDETCTTLTVGIEVPKDWKHSEKVTFTPSTGTAKTVTAQPGETKTVDFPASKGLTVKAVPSDAPDKAASITYKAPKNCTTTPATPTPSTSGPVLAITGSSSTPIAGGAVALVLLGGGAFFLARRRKMKFTA